MKLSEIKGERALDVIADIIVPVTNIAMDEEASDLFKKKRVPKGQNTNTFVAERIKASVPALLKKHKADLVTIMSLLNDISTEEYLENMTVASFTKDVLDLITDEAFTELFT